MNNEGYSFQNNEALCYTSNGANSFMPIFFFCGSASIKIFGFSGLPWRRWTNKTCFLTVLDNIADDLTSAFRIIFYFGAMQEEWKEGLICLITKGDEASKDIRACRPITLLNTIYKINAKVSALCLQPLLPDIIRTSQTGFMQGRSTFDNIFLFWEFSTLAMAKNFIVRF